MRNSIKLWRTFKSARVSAVAVGTAGFVGAVALCSAESAKRGVPARLVLLYSFMTFLALNMLAFALNLFLTMRMAKGVQTEEQLEKLMVPALQGKTEGVAGPVHAVLAALAVGSLGAALGALVVLAVRRL